MPGELDADRMAGRVRAPDGPVALPAAPYLTACCDALTTIFLRRPAPGGSAGRRSCLCRFAVSWVIIRQRRVQPYFWNRLFFGTACLGGRRLCPGFCPSAGFGGLFSSSDPFRAALDNRINTTARGFCELTWMKLNEKVTATERRINKPLIRTTVVLVLRVNMAIPVAMQCDEIKLEKNNTIQVGPTIARILNGPHSASTRIRALPGRCPHQATRQDFYAPISLTHNLQALAPGKKHRPTTSATCP